VRHWRADPIQVSACVCVLSAVFFLPVYWLYLPSTLSWDNWHAAAFQAVYQGIINSIFALICYNRAVNHLGASTTSAFLPLIPVIASLMAMPLLGEFPSLAEWSGIALAGIGVLLATGVAGRLLRTRKAETAA
jgi:drug/metabolite transporter (DMT)-like permease